MQENVQRERVESRNAEKMQRTMQKRRVYERGEL